jgi:LPXTG-motif cell wall-anchored protein
MPMPRPDRRASRASRASRAAVAALGAAGLIALAAAPAAFADDAEPDLVVGGVKPVSGLKPGSTFDVPVTVANKGTATAGKAWVTYAVTRGLDFAEVPSNCWTQHVRSYDEMPERWTAVCEYDRSVQPGALYTPETPIRVKALDRALDDELRVEVDWNAPWPDENGEDPVAGTAPAVNLVETQTGATGTKRLVDVPVTSVNTADFRVTGAALKGSVGETVPMKLQFTNAGPAWVRNTTVKVVVKPPAGTSVVKVAAFCRADGHVYYCGMRQPAYNEGGQENYTFQLRIDKRVPHAKGSVALSTEPRPFDPDKTNDKADITLDVTGADPTGTPGGTGGTGAPTSSPTTSPTGGSTSGSGGSAGGAAGGSSAPVDDGTTPPDGDLAATGSPALPIAGAAAAAMVAGAGTLVLVRRRRNQNPS